MNFDKDDTLTGTKNAFGICLDETTDIEPTVTTVVVTESTEKTPEVSEPDCFGPGSVYDADNNRCTCTIEFMKFYPIFGTCACKVRFAPSLKVFKTTFFGNKLEILENL